MIINVPDFAMNHFWEEPPDGSMEFWAFRFPVKAKIGDTIYFKHQKRTIATAIICSIEEPGTIACEQTGKYLNRWKVFWSNESFKTWKGKV